MIDRAAIRVCYALAGVIGILLAVAASSIGSAGHVDRPGQAVTAEQQEPDFGDCETLRIFAADDRSGGLKTLMLMDKPELLACDPPLPETTDHQQQ